MNSSDGGSPGGTDQSSPAGSEQGKSGPKASYPAPQSAQSRRRWFIASVATVLVAGVGIAILGFLRFADTDVSGEVVTYQILDTSTVSIQYNVTRDDPNQAVVCIVRVRDLAGAESGRREVLVTPGETNVGMNTTVRSTRPPAVGEVFGCSEAVPTYLTEGAS